MISKKINIINEKRNIWHSIWRGLLCRCPRCNVGKIYYKYLKIVHKCSYCKQELYHHQADDFPPYITIIIVGHIVLSLIIFIQNNFHLALWVNIFLWIPTIIIFSLIILPLIKAILVNIQWSLKLHDFEINDNSPKWYK